ncbi:cytosolic regulator pianissimo, putative [Entamoeba histolytica HM-1:IMSS-B]|uniref:Cytosolic regulator pianissimo, putative n=6 Tax=Entamoeba histolytica TaxID=5759 RepID=C4M692_ENTH1|nr:cytosolic regulator pianissimo, putative [Entamoeba histolytica HM-1:IMSS]EMD43263.1 cytosolic regulator pianissimo, putative [Entamoeba histolytica KU27]EMH77867.1 cytosolic regulator pianissimo, putative [Entamoeba histolytica HM-1:IMSS-B]EMS10784.1 cytosolic regulator pianissimo, putative [Entamoeba histolytica HM-3:IMSS]ENY62750.1 cytosolic regulator pianissimo, putative [Entamoeba histolytica HM-1:IMSS-A]GAT96984.1 cytosolic regulator pianissimo putative [Entamoeba histolytica]|eukprot:XP_652028.1 cytosolic regulator pianissimo, putative [Entamoeba histolytica HM-1:IMSS]
MISPRMKVEDIYDLTLKSEQLLDAFNRKTPATQIGLYEPTHEEWASLIAQLGRPSPVIRTAVIRHLICLIDISKNVPEMLLEGVGALLIAKALVDYSTIKEKEPEKVRKYKTMYQTMNRYAFTLISTILMTIQKIPVVWARAIVEASEAIDSRDTSYTELYDRLIVQIALSCPDVFGASATEALRVIFSKKTTWSQNSVKDFILFGLNSIPHKKYLGIDQLLISLISPMCSPEHWLFSQKNVLTQRINADRELKQTQYSDAIDIFFKVIQTWPGLLTLTSNKGIDILVLALRSPVPKQINMIISNLYKLFDLKQPKIQPQGVDYQESVSDNSILKNSPLVLSYYTHLLIALIDSNFFDALCDVCVGRQMHDDFSRAEILSQDSKKVDKMKTKPSHRQTISEHSQIGLEVTMIGLENNSPNEKDSSSIEEVSCITVIAKSVILLGELLYLAGLLLPQRHLSLQKLFATACNFSSNLQTSSTSLLVNLHSHIQFKIDAIIKEKKDNERYTINEYMSNDVTSDINQTLKGLNMMDETEIKRSVQASNISSNDYLTWNWDEIFKLLTSLSQNMRYVPIVEKTPFFKTLVKFYQPSKKRFSEIDCQPKEKFTPCGTMLFQILIQSENGQGLLQIILKEIAAELKYFIQMAKKEEERKRDEENKKKEDDKKKDDDKKTEEERKKEEIKKKEEEFRKFFENLNEKGHFFDQTHLMKKLSKEYFGFIGSICDMKEAHIALSDIFDLYTQVLGIRRLDPLSDLISSSFRISTNDKNTKVMEAMLNSENITLANRAIKEIRRLLISSGDITSEQMMWKGWTIPKLVENLVKKNQVKQNIKEIIIILRNAIKKEHIKKVFVEFINDKKIDNEENKEINIQQPSEIRNIFQILIDNEGEDIIYELLKNDISIQKCIESTTFVIDEYNKWMKGGYIAYIQNYDEKKRLPHFFQILSLTPIGRGILKDNNTTEKLYIEFTTSKLLINKSGAAIALSYIAANDNNDEYKLVDEDIIKCIIKSIYDESLYIRGISTWAISILCSNKKYEKMLNEEGWNKSYNGIMIPGDGLTDQFYNQHYEKVLLKNIPFSTNFLNNEQIELVKYVRKMRHANMWRSSMKELNKKRAEKQELFKNDISFNMDVCKLLDNVKTSVIQRSFVYEIFLGSLPLPSLKNQALSCSDKIIGIVKSEAPIKDSSCSTPKRNKRATKSQICSAVDPTFS